MRCLLPKAIFLPLPLKKWSISQATSQYVHWMFLCSQCECHVIAKNRNVQAVQISPNANSGYAGGLKFAQLSFWVLQIILHDKHAKPLQYFCNCASASVNNVKITPLRTSQIAQ